MKQKRLTIYVEHTPTCKELRIERRWRILENVLNVLLGVGAVAVSFYGGWLVGSGAFW